MELWTIGKILKWTENFFAERGIESPRLDAEVLLSHVLKKERIYLYVHFDEPLQAEELASFRELIKKRAARIPVAYLTGEREFMGLKFKVNKDTLIPRPDTEILVQTAVDALMKSGDSKIHFADIGTGSGAIALSILKFIPAATAETVDIVAGALKIAQENAQNLGVADRIAFHNGDLLAPLTKGENNYSAIISNPPYIPQKDIATLAPEVKNAEPMTALSGGMDGLDFYRRLCKEAPKLLTAGGFIAFEVGINQAAAVAALARENPLLNPETIKIIKDYAGIERVVIAWRK